MEKRTSFQISCILPSKIRIAIICPQSSFSNDPDVTLTTSRSRTFPPHSPVRGAAIPLGTWAAQTTIFSQIEGTALPRSAAREAAFGTATFALAVQVALVSAPLLSLPF
jgi:hypothetical protein